MNKALNPIVMAGIAAVVLAVLVLVGLRVIQPAPYTPSPGVTGGSHPGDPAAARGNPPAGSPPEGAASPGGR